MSLPEARWNFGSTHPASTKVSANPGENQLKQMNHRFGSILHSVIISPAELTFAMEGSKLSSGCKENTTSPHPSQNVLNRNNAPLTLTTLQINLSRQATRLAKIALQLHAMSHRTIAF
ncbi:predicted protein [Histoplasma capsulatum var. duboisii H88]|uniref:Predicted protein n=1 Tax=Ajellomyces capsulatus (strain H88) TaxID=544711 RepID=F0US38_AJEC8|nr:predicted protein [Histoplasma capsulatum var. duboisii H88]